MNAHAAAAQCARAPLPLRRASLRTPPSHRIQRPLPGASRASPSARYAIPVSAIMAGSLSLLGKTAGRLALGALLGSVAFLAIVNNHRNTTDHIGVLPDRNETVVYRQSPMQMAMQREAMRRALLERGSMRLASLESASIPPSSIEDEGEPAADETEERPSLYSRVVQTIKFVASADAGFSLTQGPTVATKVGAFVAFPGK